MPYEFKNLNEVPAQDKPTENTTVMAFENGVPKQIPASEFGGGAVFVKIEVGDIRTDANGNVVTVTEPYCGFEAFLVDTINYDYIYEALLKGQLVYLQLSSDAREKAEEEAFQNEAVIQFSLDAQGLLAKTNNFETYFTNGSYHTTA